MEHRYHQRTPVELRAIIRRRGQDLGPYKMRDISSTGAFIETGSIDRLCVGDYVNIQLITNQADLNVQCFNALVIHCSARGVGLMFVGHYPNGVDTLNSLMRNAA